MNSINPWIVVLSCIISITVPILVSIPFKGEWRLNALTSSLIAMSFVNWQMVVFPALFPWADLGMEYGVNPWSWLSGLGYSLGVTIIVLLILRKFHWAKREFHWFKRNKDNSS
jgi:hypothetical protein